MNEIGFDETPNGAPRGAERMLADPEDDVVTGGSTPPTAPIGTRGWLATLPPAMDGPSVFGAGSAQFGWLACSAAPTMARPLSTGDGMIVSRFGVVVADPFGLHQDGAPDEARD